VAVEHLCRYGIDRWVSGKTMVSEQPTLKRNSVTLSQHTDRTHEPAYAHLRVPLEKFVESLQLDVDMLVEQVSKMIEQEVEGSPDAFLQGELDRLVGTPVPASPRELATRLASVAAWLDQLLGARQNGSDTGRPDVGTLEGSLAPRRRKLAMDHVRQFREWLMQRVEDEDDRVRGAQWAAQWFATHCHHVEQRLAQLHERIDGELTQQEQRLEASMAPARGRQKDREKMSSGLGIVKQMARLRLYERVVAGASSIIQAVRGQVASIQDELMELERELRHLAGQFDNSRTLDEPLEDDRQGTDNLAESVTQILVDNVERLTRELEERLAREVVMPVGGLRDLLMQGGNARNQLPDTMRGVARTTVVGIMKQLDVSDVLFPHEDESQSEVDTLSECLAAARPRLLACGGAKRLLVMLPQGSTQVRPLEILHDEMNETPSVVENCDGDFILCYEVEQISLTQAAVGIIEGRRDFAEAASRLHTRNDVAWSNLPDIV